MPEFEGRAPCSNCGTPSSAKIDINSAKPDGQGGSWYRVTEKKNCDNCNKPLGPFHVPGKTPAKAEEKAIPVPNWPTKVKKEG